MGAPIRSIVIANNANHVLSDLVITGILRPTSVVPTMAPAMDVQVPSNLETLRRRPPRLCSGQVVSDDVQIRQTMSRVFSEHGYRIDPHTATAWQAAEEHHADGPQLVVATAHPSKFDGTVPPPEWYPDISKLPERVETIDPDLSELSRFLR